MRENNFVIIMAGGIGSRFWPLSRTQFPKQFHDVLGTGKTLLQMTWERFQGFIPPSNLFVVTNRMYVPLVKSQLGGIIPDENILAEPAGRNTAPTILYATSRISRINPDASIFVAASDHLILQKDKFLSDISLGLDECVKSEIIMTLGVPPTRPDTGYGYIQFEETAEPRPYYKVKTFTEKPSLEVAQTFLRTGDFLWNSGMFIFSLKTIHAAYQHYLPDMFELFQAASDKFGTGKEKEAVEQIFERCKNISIDHGVMEKAKNVFVIPASFDWSDLGTWASVYEHVPHDYLGNAAQGKAMVYNSSGNLIVNSDKNKLVVVDGLTDFVIIDTGDVLLVFRQGDEQKVREIVADVKKSQGEKYV